eukprot:m.129326 g.129326  ORF g.129326 m.129326 type:complete len:344 (+) comp13671_c0_seq2:3124-4155(+)
MLRTNVRALLGASKWPGSPVTAPTSPVAAPTATPTIVVPLSTSFRAADIAGILSVLAPAVSNITNRAWSAAPPCSNCWYAAASGGPNCTLPAQAICSTSLSSSAGVEPRAVILPISDPYATIPIRFPTGPSSPIRNVLISSRQKARIWLKYRETGLLMSTRRITSNAFGTPFALVGGGVYVTAVFGMADGNFGSPPASTRRRFSPLLPSSLIFDGGAVKRVPFGAVLVEAPIVANRPIGGTDGAPFVPSAVPRYALDAAPTPPLSPCSGRFRLEPPACAGSTDMGADAKTPPFCESPLARPDPLDPPRLPEAPLAPVGFGPPPAILPCQPDHPPNCKCFKIAS